MKFVIICRVHVMMISVMAISLVSTSLVPEATAQEYFNGPYIGGLASYDRSRTMEKRNVEPNDFGLAFPEGDPKGPVFDKLSGTALAGYGWSFDGWHVGAEVELGYGGPTLIDDFQIELGHFVQRSKPRLQFGISGRAGRFITDRTLVYGRFGFSRTQFKESRSIGETVRNGFSAVSYGGGLQFALSNRLSLRAEYVRSTYQDEFIGQEIVDVFGIVEGVQVVIDQITIDIFSDRQRSAFRGGIVFQF